MFFDKSIRFSVWVGGVEVSDYLTTIGQAQAIARNWKGEGYDDVQIDSYAIEEGEK